MNDPVLLTEIKSYLARLKTEVTISNSSNETDINIHAENLIRRILPFLFDCEVLNAGKSIKKNNESFDLFDTNGHYAFQITSTNVNKKILDSISNFIKYSWQEKYRELRTFTFAVHKVHCEQIQPDLDTPDFYEVVG